MTTRKPISDADRKARPGLRLQPTASGSWRLWWEPSSAGRKLGLTNEILDPSRPGWSLKRADDLIKKQKRATTGNRQPSMRAGSVAALVELYKRAPQFRHHISKASQADYAWALDRLIDVMGPHAVAAVTVADCEAIITNALEDKSGWVAIKLKRVGHLLFEFAELRGKRPVGSNPFSPIKVSTPKPRSRVSSWAEFDHLVATADAIGRQDIALALRLAFYHGARVTDIRDARTSEFREFEIDPEGTVWTARMDQLEEDWHEVTADSDWDVALQAADHFRLSDQGTFISWHYERSKRGKIHSTLIAGDITTIVSNYLHTHTKGQAYLFQTKRTGRPVTKRVWERWFADVRAKAAETMPSVAELQMRDIRRSHSTHARRSGASRQVAGASLGNNAGHDDALEATYMPTDFFTGSEAAMQIRRPSAPARRRRKVL